MDLHCKIFMQETITRGDGNELEQRIEKWLQEQKPKVKFLQSANSQGWLITTILYEGRNSTPTA